MAHVRVGKRLFVHFIIVASATLCAACVAPTESDESAAEVEELGSADSALNESSSCFDDPTKCNDPAPMMKTCYVKCSGCDTSVGNGYTYSDTTPNGALPDGFSGTMYGTSDIVTAAPGVMAPSYSTLATARRRDIVAFMNNAAMSFGANKSTLNYHQIDPIAVKGGYYKWYTQTGSGGNHYVVYWNANRNCAYLMTNHVAWHGAQANIFSRYAQLGYENSALGLPASNPMGAAWGVSWQRFQNGYVTNNSTGYGDMAFRTYYVAGTSGENKAIRDRYGMFFDVGTNTANAYPLTQDLGCVNSIYPGSCGAGLVGKVLKAVGPWGYVHTITAPMGATTAYAVGGEIGKKWYQVSGSQPQLGVVGWPRSEEKRNNGVTIQNFANGDIAWTSVATWIPKGGCTSCTWNSHPDQQCTSPSGYASSCGLHGRSNKPVKVDFTLTSRQRALVYGYDGGHSETYCAVKDLEWEFCDQFGDRDGLQLRPDPSGAWAIGNSDLPHVSHVDVLPIEGPYQFDGGKWEWREGTEYDWTYRSYDLVYILFEDVYGADAYGGNVTFYWDEDDGIGDDDYNWTAHIGSWMTECLANAVQPNVFYTSITDQQIDNDVQGLLCPHGGNQTCHDGEYDVRFDVRCRFRNGS